MIVWLLGIELGASDFLLMAASSSSSSDRISEDAVRKAVKALLKWKKLQLHDNDGDEDEDDDYMYLLLTLAKIPPKEQQNNIPLRIPLPHPPLQSLPNKNICLILRDSPKNSTQNLTVEAAQKKIKSENIPIATVVKLSKLKSVCNSFEAKRKLYDSHDLFLADKRVIHLLPKVLGKQFYKKKRKVPVPVELRNSWKEEVEKAVSSSLLWFGSGTSCAVRIGRWGLMESDEIVENVLAAVTAIVELVPKKWGGVRAFHLKFSESLALPIYEINN